MTLTKDIQDALVGHLQTVPGLTGVEILGRRRGTITSDIESAVATLGACIYVFPPLPTAINRENPGPYVDTMEVRLRIIEAPAINANAPDAYELVEHCLRALHHLQLAAIPGGNPIILNSAPVAEIDDPERVIFDVSATFATGYPPLS